MADLFPAKKQLYFTIIFFFLPAVFWLSGFRVDGLVFFFLSLLLYNLLKKNNPGLKKAILVVIGFAGVLICRPQIALLTGLAFLGYCGQTRFGRPALVYGTLYLISLFVFLGNYPRNIPSR